MALGGKVTIAKVSNVTSKEDCCGYCMRDQACAGAAFHAHGKLSGHCVLRKAPVKKKASVSGDTVCIPKRATGSGMEWIIDEN
jgi:hypothetical protein